MKRNLMVLLALLVCGAAWAAQDTEITDREVRDPRQLQAWLEANAADAEARLAAGGSVADTLALINAAEAGTAKVTLQADKADDAGDKYGIVATDGSGLEIQSDLSSKGTLATVASIENTGLITSLVGIDAIGAVDFDIGSDDVLDVTIVVQGGTVVIDDGTLTASDDLVATDDVRVGDDLTVTGAATVGETLGVTGNTTLAGTLGVTGNTTLAGTLDVTGAATLASTLDVDSITVDAGYGVDVQSSGTLMIGAATANKVEISIAGIETEIQGSLDVHQTAAIVGVATFTAMPVFNGGVDINEDIDIDFDATDEEINITSSVNPDVAAGAGMVTLYDSEDANGANSAYMLRIARKNDGGANNEFILCQDNSTGAAGNGDTKFAVDDAGNTTVAGTLGVTGNTTLGAAGKLITTPVASANVTNGQAVTLSGVINLLSGTGSANAATNTITIANPTAAGQWAIVYNAAAATNLIAIAKTGNFDGPALELGAGESAIIFAPSSTKWAGIGQ